MLWPLVGGQQEAGRQRTEWERMDWQKCVCLVCLMFLFCRAGGPRQKLAPSSVRLEVRSAPMSTLIPVTFCGRTFTAQEVELMRVVAHDYAGLGVTEIARTVCELLEWKRPNGRLKNHECRQLLERLQAEGALTLPALRKFGGKGLRRVDISQQSFEPEPVECKARECQPLELALVEGPVESRLWREHMERHHYLGSRVPFGANLRYWVRNRDRELACLLWTSPSQVAESGKPQHSFGCETLQQLPAFVILPSAVGPRPLQQLADRARDLGHSQSLRFGSCWSTASTHS